MSYFINEFKTTHADMHLEALGMRQLVLAHVFFHLALQLTVCHELCLRWPLHKLTLLTFHKLTQLPHARGAEGGQISMEQQQRHPARHGTTRHDTLPPHPAPSAPV